MVARISLKQRFNMSFCPLSFEPNHLIIVLLVRKAGELYVGSSGGVLCLLVGFPGGADRVLGGRLKIEES